MSKKLLFGEQENRNKHIWFLQPKLANFEKNFRKKKQKVFQCVLHS